MRPDAAPHSAPLPPVPQTPRNATSTIIVRVHAGHHDAHGALVRCATGQGSVHRLPAHPHLHVDAFLVTLPADAIDGFLHAVMSRFLEAEFGPIAARQAPETLQ